MKRVFVILAVAAQVLVLAVMAGEREWISGAGKVVYLRTAPVDPRDLFRGDFVRLRYELNNVRRDAMDAVLAQSEPKRHEVVYTRLRPVEEGLYEAAGTGSEPPGEGVFLRGRIDQHPRFGGRNDPAFVKYGIEQYFVEQGGGGVIEKQRGGRDDLQVPMEVEVAIGSSGKAVIRGYRWSRLGMKLEMIRTPARRDRNAAPPPGPLSPKLRITLANVSQGRLAIVNPGDNCAFQLVVAEWVAKSYQAAYGGCESAIAGAAEPILLAPGETYSAEIDLSEARWHVVADGKPVEIGALPDFTQFRIEYRARSSGADLATSQTSERWQGRMPSRAFNANGFVD